MSIRFTQFLRPHGTPKKVLINRPQEIEAMADRLMEKGLRLEIEVLTTGQIHMTVSDPQEGLDLHSRICSNGPAVPENVDSMIQEAHKEIVS